MRRRWSLAGVSALAVFLGAAGPEPAVSPVDVKEPVDLYTGPQHGYTPQTLAGASVVDLPKLEALIASDKPLLLDVSLADHKPEGLPPATPWFPMHRSIPGAVWLPNAGAVPLEPGQEALFLKRAEQLTGGDKGKAIVAFCHPDCWGSWNAGKRLVMAGYTNVHWFPFGIEGWQDQHETSAVLADRAWGTAMGDKQGKSEGGEAQR